MTNVQEQEKPRAKVWVDFSNLTTQFGSLAGAEIEKFTELHNKDAHRMNRHAQLLEEENARLRAAVDLRNKLDEERGAAVLEASRLKQEVADLKRMNADIADVIRGASESP
jgi:hypothetical protein